MESTFFPGVSRTITLGPPTMLVGADDTRQIKVPIHMPLTGESLRSMPDWCGEAFTAVSRHAQKMTPDIEIINDVAVSFHVDRKENGELFDIPDARCPKGQLKKFEVLRVGEADQPEVELHMVLYTAFSRDFWKWIGEWGGKKVNISFPSSIPPGTVVAAPAPKNEFVDERPELDPAFDALFQAGSDDMPPDPTLSEEFGPEYEQQVAAALQAPKKRGSRNVN